MKSRNLGWAILFGTLLCVIGCAAAATAIADDDPNAIVLNGGYIWGQGSGSGSPLKAVFIETGENQFDVSFYFNFQEKDHVFSGSVRGEMGSGTLSGEVRSDRRSRKFTFEGQFKDGRFSGSHTEVTGGNEKSTGTLWLE